MSNKTQLQANNTQLASLIQTLQGKAAGGGGASGDVNISFCAYDSMIDIPATALNSPDEYEGVTIVKGGRLFELPDDIDLNEVTMDSLVPLVPISGTETASGAPLVYPVHQLLSLEKDAVSYRRTVDGLEKLMLDIPDYETSLTILVRLTASDLSSFGVNGTPGVYSLGSPNWISDFPFIMMRIGS